MHVATEPAATPDEIAAIVAVLDAARAEPAAPGRSFAPAWRTAALREGIAPFDVAVGGSR